jgi:hypothetical protein
MAFEQNPDGSTSRIFVQLSDLNGFAVLDFKTRQETARITCRSWDPARRKCRKAATPRTAWQ